LDKGLIVMMERLVKLRDAVTQVKNKPQLMEMGAVNVLVTRAEDALQRLEWLELTVMGLPMELLQGSHDEVANFWDDIENCNVMDILERLEEENEGKDN
jgi:hypothetical protein